MCEKWGAGAGTATLRVVIPVSLTAELHVPVPPSCPVTASIYVEERISSQLVYSTGSTGSTGAAPSASRPLTASGVVDVNSELLLNAYQAFVTRY